MRRFTFLFFALALVTGLGAQALAVVDTPVAASEPASTVMNRAVPAFPGGNQAFSNFLTENLAYPELAVDYAVEGTVVVEVKVAASGETSVVGIARPLFAPLDEAALAAARRLPAFAPAIKNGRPEARTLMIPFHFSLQ